MLLAHLAGLLGCPQFLDDGFDTVRASPDGGLGGMTLTGRGGTAGSAGSEPGGAGGSAGSGGSAGTDGTPGGTGGTADAAGTGGSSAGTGGTGGTSAGTGGTSAGTGGTSAGTGGTSAGTGGTGGTSGDTPECWTFELTTPNADHESNCVGIEGYNQIEDDEPNSSVVSLEYDDGEACFEGTIAATGWGAVYSHVFRNLGAANDSLVWDATAYGVTGFELTTTGDDLPPSFTVTYATNVDNLSLRDYCQTIGTGAALVPFAGATRDNCSGGNTGALTDTTELEALRLSFPVTGAAYAVDFCLRIRAF